MVVLNYILATFNSKINTILLFTIAKLWSQPRCLSRYECKDKCDEYVQFI